MTAENAATNTETTSSEYSEKIQRRMNSNKKLENKIRDNKLMLKLKKEGEELEIKDIKTKFEIAENVFLDTFINKNKRTAYKVPKFSCVERKNNVLILKYYLSNKGKKPAWLGLDSSILKNIDNINDINDIDSGIKLNSEEKLQDNKELPWMTGVSEKARTVNQLNIEGQNRIELLSLLKKYSMIVPIPYPESDSSLKESSDS